MIQSPPSGKPAVSWLIAWIWVVIVFATIPMARTIQQAVTEALGPDAYVYMVLGILGLGALWVLGYLLRNRHRFAWYHVLWLVVIASIYARETWHLKSKSPTEALHFVQYGLMYLLFLRAFLHRTHDLLVFPLALCLTSICGNLDEVVQWMTPRRYFDWRDVGLNAFSGLMMGLLFLGAIRPAYLKPVPTVYSMWRLVRSGIVHATVSLLCLINTPERTAWVVDQFPVLERWSGNWGEMSEYGFLYRDPAIGQFKSRLSPEALAAYDREHGAEAATIMNTQGGMEYGEFLREVAPVTRPYLHEIRVHLHRRGRYLKGRIEHRGSDAEEYARQTSVAVREHRILTGYYPMFMAGFNNRLTGEWLAAMEGEMLQDYDYFSPVSKGLLVDFSEADVWKVYGITVFVFLGIGVGYARGQRKRQQD